MTTEARHDQGSKGHECMTTEASVMKARRPLNFSSNTDYLNDDRQLILDLVLEHLVCFLPHLQQTDARLLQSQHPHAKLLQSQHPHAKLLQSQPSF